MTACDVMSVSINLSETRDEGHTEYCEPVCTIKSLLDTRSVTKKARLLLSPLEECDVFTSSRNSFPVVSDKITELHTNESCR